MITLIGYDEAKRLRTDFRSATPRGTVILIAPDGAEDDPDVFPVGVDIGASYVMFVPTANNRLLAEIADLVRPTEEVGG